MENVVQILDSIGTPERAAEIISRTPGNLRPGGRTVSRGNIYLWRHRGRIPLNWIPAVFAAARSAGRPLTEGDLLKAVIGERAADLKDEL